MTGEGGVSAALRAVREGRVPGQESSGEEGEEERADFSTDTESGCGEEYWSESSSSVGEEPPGDTGSEASSSSAGSSAYPERPRVPYHEVVEAEGSLDDAAGLVGAELWH